MPKMFQIQRIKGISDDAVKERTSRKWAEWFKLLDKMGGRMMEHKDIVRALREQHGLSTWWSQSVAVGYEQDRGMRIKHQKGVRYAVAVSKTMAAPTAAIWNAWHDRAARDAWLPGARFEFGKLTPRRIMHLDWPDGSRVSVTLMDARGKCKVLVSHGKLTENAQVAEVHLYWSAALERLKAMLEGTR